MNGPLQTFTIVMLFCALLLTLGGLWLLFTRKDLRTQGWLMLLCAVIMAGNVVIWFLPVP